MMACEINGLRGGEMSTDAMDEGAAEMGGMQIDIVQSEVNEPANEMEVIWCGWELQEAEDAYNEWMSDGCPHGGRCDG